MFGHSSRFSMGICVADNRTNDSYFIGLRQLPLSLFSASMHLCSSVQLRVHCKADRTLFAEDDCQKQQPQTIVERYRYFSRSRAPRTCVKLRKVMADVDIMATNVAVPDLRGSPSNNCRESCSLKVLENRSRKIVSSVCCAMESRVSDVLDRLLPELCAVGILRSYPYARFLMACCRQTVGSHAVDKQSVSQCDSPGSVTYNGRSTECRPLASMQSADCRCETESSCGNSSALSTDGDDLCDFRDDIHAGINGKNGITACASLLPAVCNNTAAAAAALADDGDDCDDDISDEEDKMQSSDCSLVDSMNVIPSDDANHWSKRSSFFFRGSDSDSSESSDSDTDDDADADDENEDSESDCWDEDEWTSSIDTADCFLEDLDPLRMTGLYIPQMSSVPVARPQSQPMISPDSAAGGADSKYTRWLKRINDKWKDWYDSDQPTAQHECHSRQVKFSSDPPTFISVLNEVEWASDYAAARVGPWRAMAVDRARFAKRVEETEQLISWVLSAQHRKNILSKLQNCQN